MSRTIFLLTVFLFIEPSMWSLHPTASALLTDRRQQRRSLFGETKEEALNQTREAILGYLEAAEKKRIPLPGAIELVDFEAAIG